MVLIWGSSLSMQVIPCYTPQCGDPSCIFCFPPRGKRTNLCPKIRGTQGQGVMPDGTTRFTDSNGDEIFHFMGCSTFSEYTVRASSLPLVVPLESVSSFLQLLARLSFEVPC